MKLYNINELKDSRIFFDKKPPIFLSIFICFLLIILLFSFYYSKVSIKPYVVKAPGIITTSDNQFISPQINGAVVSIKAVEGQKVSKDEVLFIISNGQEGLQNSALMQQVQNLNTKLEVMKRYEESLKKKVNQMKNSGIEQAYYGKVEYYLLQVKTQNFDKKNLTTQLSYKKQKKKELNSELNKLTNQLNSMEKDDIKKSEIQGKIDAKKSEMDGIQQEISQLEQQINNPSSQAQEIYNQLTSELGTERFEIESKIVELEGQILINNGQDSSLIVKSKNNGIVHYLVPLQVGMSIQANQIVAEVSKNSDQDSQVEAYIDAKDISKVNIGNKVQIAIDGVNTYKFGTIEGMLLSIDSGTVTQETREGNKIYYKGLVRLSKSKLRASDGTTVKLIKSMPVESRIVYEEETYYEWIMKMLNFKNF